MEQTFVVSGNEGGLPESAKQDLDLAFAVLLIRSGHVTERQFSRAIADWTVHGATTLAEHLTTAGLISPSTAAERQSEASESLEQIQSRLADDPSFASETQLAGARLPMIDPSGRIVRMLGLSDRPLLTGTSEARQAFNQFTLVRKLGEGGLGTVWLARDENLKRFVAIKEIRKRDGPTGEAAIARFQREAEITGRLEHPGIVPIYQLGHDSGTGQSFYAMRFLGKRSMQDAIAEYHERRESGTDEPVLLHRLLAGFANLCKSVAHAHSKNVIHRDLKPENVALDNFGQFVLLDWGLARINDETSSDDDAFHEQLADTPDMTMAGEVLGSPMYMAPEQASGRNEEIDERTDIYGLGGILFSILTGEAPHEQSKDSLAGQTTRKALLTAIVSRELPRPKEIVPNIPPALDAICVKALARKRYLRYRTARALAEDMERYMAGGNVSAYEATWRERVRLWITAHPRASPLLASILTLIVIVGGMAMLTRQRTDAARQAARYDSARDLIQELQISLQSDARALAQDLRFVSGLPPVESIAATSNPEADGLRNETISRLSSIFSGLLRGRESYLTIALTTSSTDGQEIQEIVRSDRNRTRQAVRAVPASRLNSFEPTEQIAEWQAMKPGDILLKATAQLSDAIPIHNRDALTIVGGTPIFDSTTGALFGFTVIELDLRSLFLEQLNARGRDSAEILITDEKGVIQLRYLNGERSPHHIGKPIHDLISEAAPLFSPESDTRKYTNGRTIVARRIRLGDQSAETEVELGVIVRLPDVE